MLFIASHLHSGSAEFISALNLNPRIDIKNLGLSYDHPTNLEYLFSRGHKLNNSAAIYGDQILYNKDFSCKAFYKFSKFIYIIGSAKDTLEQILTNYSELDELRATRYYCFRLRRLYEMARETPGAVFLTKENLSDPKASELIECYLGLTSSIPIIKLSENKSEKQISYKLLTSAQDCYERYLFLFKQINLKLI